MMLFTVLSIVFSNKINFVLILWKKINRELLIIKEDDEHFENCTKCWICDHAYIEGDVKVRDHCHITGKYRVSTHGDCNINV